MLIDILTIFPDMFQGPFNYSMLKRAVEKELVKIRIIDIRDYTTDKHKVTDDYPYGGGSGMVMKPEPIAKAIEHALGQEKKAPDTAVIFLTPQGIPFNQAVAKELVRLKHLVLLCGHYEGIDERIREMFIDQEISIGDYVLTGGEIPAMVLIDAIVRLLPGVLGDENSYQQDSFYQGLLDYPQYTRPEVFRGHRVPEVLLGGHHQKIRQWRRRKAIERTLQRRPDLLNAAALSAEDKKILAEIKQELKKQ